MRVRHVDARSAGGGPHVAVKARDAVEPLVTRLEVRHARAAPGQLEGAHQLLDLASCRLLRGRQRARLHGLLARG